MKRVLVVGNPLAHGGTALKQYHQFLTFLEAQKHIAFHSYLTKKCFDEEGISEAIQSFLPNIISVIGGDGTINDVLNVPQARKCILHLIPAGSGNDFSKLINGKLNNHEAFRLANSDKTGKFDTGICNDRYFLNGVGIGFDGSVAKETILTKLPFSTSWKYWIAILRNILFYRSTEMSIEVNHQTINQKAFMVSVANGKEYGGGFCISPLSEPSDRLLNLVIINQINPLARLRYIPIVKKGNHLGLSIVSHQTTDCVVIESAQTVNAHLDGELMSGKRFEVKIAEQVEILIR